MDRLSQGSFVGQGANILAFGLPGAEKSHALFAVGHRLVETGHSVLCAQAYRLVQSLSLGAEEAEVLFTLIAERYERRSLGITSNLVFSDWERIFANPMATAAAIDRGWSPTPPLTG